MRPCLTSLPSFDEKEERIFHKGSNKSGLLRVEMCFLKCEVGVYVWGGVGGGGTSRPLC